MAAYLPEHATLGSLFDGIGGFPLVWETYHGKGTAIWGSEIEPCRRFSGHKNHSEGVLVLPCMRLVCWRTGRSVWKKAQSAEEELLRQVRTED